LLEGQSGLDKISSPIRSHRWEGDRQGRTDRAAFQSGNPAAVAEEKPIAAIVIVDGGRTSNKVLIARSPQPWPGKSKLTPGWRHHFMVSGAACRRQVIAQSSHQESRLDYGLEQPGILDEIGATRGA
jgi:hypothetical protein